MTAFHKKMSLTGAQYRSVREIDETATLTPDDDYIVLADATAGAIVLNLPPAAAAYDAARGAGMVVVVKRLNDGANAVTITPDGAEAVDGAGTLALGTQYHVATIVSDGTTWHRIGS
jgi:hypothetical protein